jgi:kynurenine formamidase
MHEKMPVYPGIERPKLTTVNTVEEHGYMGTHLSMFSHAGTHMDAPSHMLANAMLLDDMPIEHFVTKALVIDASDCKEGDLITMDYINKVKDKADKADAILFRTDWDKNWDNEEKYFGNYPVINSEVAQYLIDSKKKCIGFDVMGIDPMTESDDPFAMHIKVFNAMDTVIVENLTNLKACGDDIFLFAALPLYYKKSDGAPIRAVGILDVL